MALRRGCAPLVARLTETSAGLLMLNLHRSSCLVAVVALTGCADQATTAPSALANGQLPVSFCCGGGSPSPWTATKLTLPTGTWVSSTAKAINDSGVIVGIVEVATYKYRPVRWVNGTPSYLVVTTQEHWAVPNAINAGGDVAGQIQWISANASTPVKPIRWLMPGGLPQPLSTLGWDGWALDINNARTVVGMSRATSGGAKHAVKWSSAGTITDLNPLGATWSQASGISDIGEIVGVASFAGVVHGWKWKVDNSQLDLGVVFNESVGDINTNSEVVGTALYNGVSQAVMWTPNGMKLPIAGAGSGTIGVSTSNGRRVIGVNGTDAWTSRSDPAPVKLPFPIGAGYTYPADVNRCGSIVGHAAGGSLPIQTAVRWTKATCDP